jgi:phosphoserine phosphatase
MKDIEDRLAELITHIPQVGNKRKVVAFDLDNTLLVGDIGEATYIRLKINQQEAPLTIDKQPMGFSWEQYEALLAKNDTRTAYSQILAAMDRVPVSLVRETTAKVMHCDQSYLEAEGARVPVPYPNPVMQAFKTHLEELGYEIYVISASHEISVKYVAKEFFSIPEDHVIAMRSRVTNVTGVDGPVLTSELIEPLTVGDGKAQAYHKFIGPDAPLITAGDSTSDLPILKLTDAEGLIVWVGETDKKLHWLKQNLPHPELVYFLKQ